MKNIFILALSFFSFSALAQSDISGIWLTGEENTKIEISESDGVLTGKIHSSENPKAQVGNTMLKNLKQKGNTWTGQLYAAKRDKWVDVTITPKSEALELKVKVGFVSRTIEWAKNK